MSEFVAEIKKRKMPKEKEGQKPKRQKKHVKKDKKEEKKIVIDEDIGKEISTDDGFRWRNVQYHLTYRGHLDYTEVENLIAGVFSPTRIDAFSIVHESSDGDHPYDHTHVYFHLEGTRQKRGSRLLDFGDVHPNVRDVFSYHHAENIFGYHLKSPATPPKQYGLSEVPKKGEYMVKAFADIHNRILTGDHESIAKDYPAEYYRCRHSIKAEIAEQEGTLKPLTVAANYWYHGPPNTGKSTYARQKLEEMFGGFYVYNKTKWWDGYTGQKAVLIEELSPKSAEGQADFYKVLLDLYPIRVEKKGSSMVIRPQVIIITSNYFIAEVFPLDVKAMHSRVRVKEFTEVFVDEKPRDEELDSVFLEDRTACRQICKE